MFRRNGLVQNLPVGSALSALVTSLENWDHPHVPRHVLDALPIDLVERHRIVLHVRHLWERRGDAVPPDLSRRFEELAYRRNFLEQELSEVAREATGRRLRFALIKGFAFESYYPRGYARDFGDLDLVVPSLEEFDAFLDLLHGRGYHVGSAIVALRPQVPGASPCVGVAVENQGSDARHACKVDLSAGGHFISHLTFCAIPDSLWHEPPTISLRGVPIPILPVVHNFVL
ncbi:MAG: nucleotidyltransferase family protein, partial [Chloroflexi bacterium]